MKGGVEGTLEVGWEAMDGFKRCLVGGLDD